TSSSTSTKRSSSTGSRHRRASTGLFSPARVASTPLARRLARRISAADRRNLSSPLSLFPTGGGFHVEHVALAPCQAVDGDGRNARARPTRVRAGSDDERHGNRFD